MRHPGTRVRACARCSGVDRPEPPTSSRESVLNFASSSGGVWGVAGFQTVLLCLRRPHARPAPPASTKVKLEAAPGGKQYQRGQARDTTLLYATERLQDLH